MNLAIDIGNSLTKAGIFEQGVLQHSISCKDLSPGLLHSLQRDYPVKGCIVSSVGRLPDHIASGFDPGFPFIELNSQTKVPFVNLYATPQTLGNDRRALATGGMTKFPGNNVLVIGLGTAITYDFLDRDKNYHGGAISPGLQLRLKSLNTFTENLPLINHNEFQGYIGRTTSQSIAAGVMEGINGELKHLIKLYNDNFSPLKVILTGGDAKYFDKNLKNNIFVIPNLVLVGLNKILEFNA
ncbi:MAG: type III pantothenate kinase [Bacteroidales bacterium]